MWKLKVCSMNVQNTVEMCCDYNVQDINFVAEWSDVCIIRNTHM